MFSVINNVQVQFSVHVTAYYIYDSPNIHMVGHWTLSIGHWSFYVNRPLSYVHLSSFKMFMFRCSRFAIELLQWSHLILLCILYIRFVEYVFDIPIIPIIICDACTWCACPKFQWEINYDTLINLTACIHGFLQYAVLYVSDWWLVTGDW